MSLDTYITCLLIGVPLVLLATHVREAWDFLDKAFARMTAGSRGLPLLPDACETSEDVAEIRRAA